MSALTDGILLNVVSVITDPVTTTDELIPSGETSSFRSNPLKLAEFTLSRKDPGYVERAKKIQSLEKARIEGKTLPEMEAVYSLVKKTPEGSGLSEDALKKIGIGSVVYALKPGDGSAREQAASCQKVLGGWANIALEYATKRYRSNLINWGMVPFTISKELVSSGGEPPFGLGDYIFVPGIKEAVEKGSEKIKAYVISKDSVKEIELMISELTNDEKNIILDGCLINYYRNRN